jgi:hypothetical protein
MTRPYLRLIGKNLNQKPSRLDWATVEHALSSSGEQTEKRTVKLQRLILNRLFDIPGHEADECITEGGDDCGIDSFFIDNNDNKIHLISTKTVEAYDKAKKNFPGGEVSKLICFVRDFVDHKDVLLTRCNPLLRAKVVEAWHSMNVGCVFEICVHLCSNQGALIDRDLKVLREGLADTRATVFEFHLVHLSDEVTRNWTAPTSKPLRFVGRELFEHVDADLGFSAKSLIGSVRVTDLAAFLRHDDTGFVDEGLFHANVRGHLGIQNPVNRDIAATLQSAKNDRFFYLNNGITIVCEKYLYQSGGFPVTLHRPQIVNGRQTAETIFQAFREDPASTADVVAMVRVIETSDPSLIEEISVATNSQSRIGSRDLRANSVIAKKLASSLSQLGYYYVRKRGEKSLAPPEQTIDALKAGQLIFAYVRGLPEKAKTDTASMFGEEFDTVFDPNVITPDLLITAHRLFLAIEADKHRAMLAMRQSGLSAQSTEHWLIEGAFHVLYCTGLMARKSQLDMSDYTNCVGLIPHALTAVSQYYDQNDRVAAYRLFRSVKARDDLRQIIGVGPEASNSNVRQLRFEF